MDKVNEKFNSVDDLYKRILPALDTKVSELKREKINFIKCEDIWNYCVQYKWKNRSDLRIYEMINDIFEIDIIDLNSYKKSLNKEIVKDDKIER